MQRDKYGRPFLTGREEGPEEMMCLKCGEMPFLRGNPFGTHLFEFSRGDEPMARSAFALCDTCSIALWEFLTPAVLSMPAYIAKKDQHMAGIPHCVALWNERAVKVENWDCVIPVDND